MSSPQAVDVNLDRSGDQEAAGDRKPGQDGRTFTENATRDRPSKDYFSCAGCLYYSESFRAAGRNPFCAGITRNLGTINQSQVGGSRANELNQVKGGDFRYSCIGYTTFTRTLGDASGATNTQDSHREAPIQLPLCTGLEVLITNSSRVPNASSGDPPSKHSPYPAGSREDAAYHAELARARRQASLAGQAGGLPPTQGGPGKKQDGSAPKCDGHGGDRLGDQAAVDAGTRAPSYPSGPRGHAPASAATSATTSVREAERPPPGQAAPPSNDFSTRLARSSGKILRRLVLDIAHLGKMVKQGVESVVSGGSSRGPGGAGGRG